MLDAGPMEWPVIGHRPHSVSVAPCSENTSTTGEAWGSKCFQAMPREPRA